MLPGTLIASTVRGTGTNGGPTLAIDTTGADLLVVAVSWFDTTGTANVTLTDSKGNTWTPLTKGYQNPSSCRIWYCRGGTVGTGHTFSATLGGAYPTVYAAAFSGAIAGDPFDVEGGNGASGVSSLAAGSVTPTTTDNLVIAAISTGTASTFHLISDGFTGSFLNYSAGTVYGGGGAFLFQETAALASPTISWTGSAAGASRTAVFKMVPGVPSTTTVRLTQEVVEVLESGTPEVRLTQEVTEVLSAASPEVRLAQAAVEVLRTVSSTSGVVKTLAAVRGLVQNATGGTVDTLDITARAVTWDRVQAVASGVLLGRGTAGAGDIETIIVGTGLSLSGGALTASAGTTFLDGDGPPTNSLGTPGDYYTDTLNGVFYGPKSASGYGADQHITVASSPSQGISREYGTQIRFPRTGRITRVRYKRYAGASDTLTIRVWDDATGLKLTEIADTQVGGVGYFTVTLPLAVYVAAGATLTFSYGAASIPYTGATQTVTSTADCTFVEFRQSVTVGNYPGGSAAQTSWVEPIFEPDEAWQQTVLITPLFGSATPGQTPASGGGAVNFLRADGAWSQISLTTNVTGTLPVARGGTNLTAVGANGTVLTVVSGAPAWQAPAAGGITAEDAQDAAAAMIAAGTHTGITFSYNDAANSLSATVTGGGGGLTAEDVDDRVAAILESGVGISIVYDDAGNTLTISNTGGLGLESTETVELTYTPPLAREVARVTAVTRQQMSIASDAGGLKLDGDSASPGASKLYGTDAAGVRGWQSAAAPPVAPGGRLSAGLSGPVSGDVLAATFVRYSPYMHGGIQLWNGSAWVEVSFPPTNHTPPGLAANTNYDVFGYLSSGTLALEATAWMNDTTRTWPIDYYDGRVCKNSDKTRLYLGTFRTTGAAQLEDSVQKRFVWNMYNRVQRQLYRANAYGSWSYSGAAFRPCTGDAGHRVDFVLGQAGDPIWLFAGLLTDTASVVARMTGFSIDQTSGWSNSYSLNEQGTAPTWEVVNAHLMISLNPGYHWVTQLEYTAGVAVNFYGGGYGMYGWLWG